VQAGVHVVDREGGEARLARLGELGVEMVHLAARESGILASMGSRGDAYDNAAAESFMATIKKELIYRHTFKSRNAARLAIFDYIECFYNPVRRHSTLGNISPADYELAAATATS
jgi:transposase InsO family protein